MKRMEIDPPDTACYGEENSPLAQEHDIRAKDILKRSHSVMS